MLDLTPEDLPGRLVDWAAGPASFNAELSAEGRDDTSCDPLYDLTAPEIRSRIDATFDVLVVNARASREEFVWRDFTSPDHLGDVRLAVMQHFLADFPRGLDSGRYRAVSLPHLDFCEGEFDLPSARTFSSRIRSDSLSTFTSPRSGRCVVSPRRRASSRCSSVTGDRHPTWRR